MMDSGTVDAKVDQLMVAIEGFIVANIELMSDEPSVFARGKAACYRKSIELTLKGLFREILGEKGEW